MEIAQSLSKEDLRQRIARLPRVRLANLPTALEDCPRLTEALGGARVLIKRDDQMGLAGGGSETRMLEFVLAEARAQGADTLVAGDGVAQSNYARQLAAAAAKLGMKSVLVLRPGPKGPLMQGNLLLDHLLGAEVRLVEPPDPAAGMAPVMEDLSAKLRQQGKKPYLVRPGALAAAAYVECALEIDEQLATLGRRADYVFVASSGVAEAGLMVGGRALGASFEVVGVSPDRAAPDRRRRIADLAGEVARLLGLELGFAADDVTNLEDYVGVAYGMPTKAGSEATILVAQSEGIILDPIYTAKAFAALADYVRKGRAGRDQTVVFVHTGGLPALFAYNLEMYNALQT